jgi:hypothetical protein
MGFPTGACRAYAYQEANSLLLAIYGRAYVDTAESAEYDRVLEALLKDRISERRNPMSQVLEPSRHGEPRLTRAISDFEENRPREGQLQLITGNVGAGKSLFVRRYKELLQPQTERNKRYWSVIDYTLGPPDLRTAQLWLCQAFLRSFMEENPDFDIFGQASLEQIFAVELNRQRGIYEALRGISEEKAALRRIDDLAGWKDDPQKLGFALCRFIGGTRREVVVIVMDNVDRRNLNDQLEAFQLSLWFMKESRAFVILQMRGETYERFKNQPPLDTFRTSIGFHISPPHFVNLVKKRLDLSLEYLTSQTDDRLVYALPNGMRISYPNTRIGEFLKVLYLDIFHYKKNVSRVLQGLAGADVRKALQMFQAILTSGHLSEDAITSQAQGAGSIVIPEYTVLKILMRTDYRFFHDDSGFVKNIFAFDQTWENPNNFIFIEILFFLSSRRRVRGQIGLEGYFSIEHIANCLELQGFLRSDVLNAANHLVKISLVEADHMNIDKVALSDSIKISASGFIHLRILSERLEYLYGVLPVTPIFERDVATRIANFIDLENRQGTLAAYQMVNCVRQFAQYLEYQASKIRGNFTEFGNEDSGTAYILKQVQNTLTHFRSPRAGERAPNLLDCLAFKS